MNSHKRKWNSSWSDVPPERKRKEFSEIACPDRRGGVKRLKMGSGTRTCRLAISRGNIADETCAK